MKTSSMDKFTSNLSYLCSSIFATLGALSRDEWAFIIGIVLSVATFTYNVYHKRQVRKILKKKSWIDHEKID